jgi:hypothetical protein
MTRRAEPTAAAEATPVLIGGGGLVGLSTALFLAWHGDKEPPREHPARSPFDPHHGG